MLKNLKIRNKLILLVAAPIVIIVLLSFLGARSRQSTAATSHRVAGQVSMVDADNSIVDALQRESLYSAAYVASGHTAWKNELDVARKATDSAAAQADAEMSGGLQHTSSDFQAASKVAVGTPAALTKLRAGVDGTAPWATVVQSYGTLQDAYLSVSRAVTQAVTDPLVANQLRSASALAGYKAVVGRQSSVLVGGTEQGHLAAGAQFNALTASVADETTQKAVLDAVVDSSWNTDISSALGSSSHQDLQSVRQVVLAKGPGARITTSGSALTRDADTVLKDLNGVESNHLNQVISSSQSKGATDGKAANFFIISAALATLIAAVGALILGRQITIPLRHLTEAADRLATQQMPRLIESLKNPSEDDLGFQLGAMNDIEVESNDELGRLAKSFNDVQRVASEVATEQAALLRKGIGEMFVNLARRNQALLDRQIEFIDELESGEEDPDQLQNLYRLDHLATRMRRNAESLLVLAGAEPPRRRGKPAPLANVVRAALAEVEDFSRIELLSFDEVLVASNAAADLAHLLSELMENATNFSPPETKVEVVGHTTQADGYVISVTDHGIGMSSEQVIEANEALAKPPLVGLALSRSLGFIVVGRLARRHGITVRMMPSPSGGVTAVVSLPSTLVTNDPGYASTLADQQASVPERLKPVMDTAVAHTSPEHEYEHERKDAFGFDLSAPLVEPLSYTPSPEPASSGGAGGGGGERGPSVFDDAPARLEEAVPTGAAFDAGLEALISATPEDPVIGPAIVDDPRLGDLPPRRKTNGRAGSPAGAPDPEPAAPPAAPPAARAPLPEALFFTDPAPVAPAQTVPAPAPAPVGPPLAPAAPEPPIPAAPAAAVPVARSAGHLDGRPPAAPSSAPSSDSRPFFLEESPPPRLFGQPAAPEHAPTPAPAPAPAPALARRAAPVAPTPPPVPAPVAAPAAPAAPAPAPALTTAGLAKRVPRQAGGARAIPGADVERGVSASKRSPDEVRNLLSSYNAGRARARTGEPVPAGSHDPGPAGPSHLDEREPNE